MQIVQLDRELAFEHYERLHQRRQEKENEKVKDKDIKKGDLVLKYESKLNSTFHTIFQTKWEGPYKVEQKFSNETYQLQNLDGRSHKRRVNRIKLKKYVAQLMVAYKEFIRKEEELNDDVQDPKEEDLNLSNLFELLLKMNVTAEKWDY